MRSALGPPDFMQTPTVPYNHLQRKAHALNLGHGSSPASSNYPQLDSKYRQMRMRTLRFRSRIVSGPKLEAHVSSLQSCMAQIRGPCFNTAVLRKEEMFDLITNWEPVFQQFISCQRARGAQIPSFSCPFRLVSLVWF